MLYALSAVLLTAVALVLLMTFGPWASLPTLTLAFGFLVLAEREAR